jgi:hypothetical protein
MARLIHDTDVKCFGTTYYWTDAADGYSGIKRERVSVGESRPNGSCVYLQPLARALGQK